MRKHAFDGFSCIYCIYLLFLAQTGAIVLDEKKVVWVPDTNTNAKKQNKKKDTLQSIIDKVNERFDGQFTDADRVIIEGIYRMFMQLICFERKNI